MTAKIARAMLGASHVPTAARFVKLDVTSTCSG